MVPIENPNSDLTSHIGRTQKIVTSDIWTINSSGFKNAKKDVFYNVFLKLKIHVYILNI